MKSILYHWQLSLQNPANVDIQYFPQKQHFHSLDMHQAVHVIHVLSGEYRMYSEGGKTTLKAGDVLFTAPWEIHGDNDLEEETRLLVVTVECGTLLASLLECRERLLSFFSLPQAMRAGILKKTNAETLAKKLAGDIKNGSSGDPRIVRMRQWLAIQSFFVEFVNTLLSVDFPVCPTENFRKLEPAIRLMSELRPVSLQEASAACGISESYFSHLFKTTYHIPFSVFEIRGRVNRAARLLREGKSVKVAAEEAGFYDTSHFTKYFTKYFGISPGQFC